MHLFGLNDLNMTLEEFINKSSEIASRRVRLEAMQSAKDIESQMRNTMRSSIYDYTDSGTY